MNTRILRLLIPALLLGSPMAAAAAVLCSNASGSVFVRDQCKAHEQQLDPTALGLIGPQGPQGPPGPQGPSGLSGHQIVAHQEFLPPGTFTAVRVDCPVGKKVLGGGFDIETPDDVKVYASGPSDGQGNLVDYGWSVIVHNTGTLVRQTSVNAICAIVQ